MCIIMIYGRTTILHYAFSLVDAHTSVMVVFSGLRMTFDLSGFTCRARRIRISREKAVYDEMVLSQSSYRLNRHCK